MVKINDVKSLMYRVDKLNEGYCYDEKIKTVKNFLDKNFKRSSQVVRDSDGFGLPIEKDCVTVVDMYNNTYETIDDTQLFLKLQSRFKKMWVDPIERDKMLLQIMKDWYSGHLSKYNSLSRYPTQYD